MPFIFTRDDITKVRADAIVNITDDCEAGKARLEKGNNQLCKYIIHTTTPAWNGGNDNEEKLLYSCYKSSLELAGRHRCKSVAFPLISANGYHKRRELDIATNAVSDFLRDNEMKVILAVPDKDITGIGGSLSDKIEKYIADNYVDEPSGKTSAAPFDTSYMVRGEKHSFSGAKKFIETGTDKRLKKS